MHVLAGTNLLTLPNMTPYLLISPDWGICLELECSYTGIIRHIYIYASKVDSSHISNPFRCTSMQSSEFPLWTDISVKEMQDRSEAIYTLTYYIDFLWLFESFPDSYQTENCEIYIYQLTASCLLLLPSASPKRLRSHHNIQCHAAQIIWMLIMSSHDLMKT